MPLARSSTLTKHLGYCLILSKWNKFFFYLNTEDQSCDLSRQHFTTLIFFILHNKNIAFTACFVLQIGVHWVLHIKLWQPTKLLQQQSNNMLFEFFFLSFYSKMPSLQSLSYTYIFYKLFLCFFLWTFIFKICSKFIFFTFLYFFHSWTMYISAKKVCLTHSYTN